MAELIFIVTMIISYLTGNCVVGEASSMTHETAPVRSTIVECWGVGYIIIEDNVVVDWGP